MVPSDAEAPEDRVEAKDVGSDMGYARDFVSSCR